MIRQSHSDSPAAKPSAPEARPLAAGAPSWAIGTFRGYDAGERTNVEVTVLQGGSVTGTAGSRAFAGSLEDRRLIAGTHHFRIERVGNGFIATDENDSRHQVVFSFVGPSDAQLPR